MNTLEVKVAAARMVDVPDIVALVERFARRGEVLPRPPEEVYQSLREWVVAREGDRLVGCASLVILWADLAEIRSLVVTPDQQGRGVGRRLVGALLHQAAELEIPQVFALTRKPGFFVKMGFQPVARETLPRKIWKDCIHCIKFVGCDEVAFIRDVAARHTSRSAPGIQISAPTPSGTTASGNGHT